MLTRRETVHVYMDISKPCDETEDKRLHDGGVALSPTGQPLCHQQLIHRKYSSLVVGVVEPSFQKQSAMLVCVVAGAGSLTHFLSPDKHSVLHHQPASSPLSLPSQKRWDPIISWSENGNALIVDRKPGRNNVPLGHVKASAAAGRCIPVMFNCWRVAV